MKWLQVNISNEKKVKTYKNLISTISGPIEGAQVLFFLVMLQYLRIEKRIVAEVVKQQICEFANVECIGLWVTGVTKEFLKRQF